MRKKERVGLSVGLSWTRLALAPLLIHKKPKETEREGKKEATKKRKKHPFQNCFEREKEEICGLLNRQGKRDDDGLFFLHNFRHKQHFYPARMVRA